jgi:hypothetical protein
VTMTNLVFPPQRAKRIQFYATGGEPGAVSGTVWKLKSAH